MDEAAVSFAGWNMFQGAACLPAASAGVPPTVTFATKPQAGADMIEMPSTEGGLPRFSGGGLMDSCVTRP